MDIVASGQITLTDLNDMTVSTTAPLNPYIGQLWWNVEEEQLYIYQNEEWIKSDKKILEQVDELGETIQTVSSALSSKVDDTTYKSFVQQTSTSLASKISAIDVENNYVKTSTFTQTVEGIQTTVKDKVSSSQFTQLAGVVESKMNTQDANAKFATQSQLTQTSSSLTSSITAVQNDLSNLSIGGRNYAVGTGNSKTFTGKGGSNETDTLYYVNFSKLAGKTITISFDYKATTSGNNARFRVQQATSPYISITEQNIYTKTELTHYSYTMNLSSTANEPRYLNIRMDDFTGSITISNLKLEIGSKATDWTPATEDMVDFPTYNSYVQQTAESLSSKLSIIDANSKFATQSQLTQTASSISTSISNVQKNLDNLEVGGRNLIRNGNFRFGTDGWRGFQNFGNIKAVDDSTFGKVLEVTIDNSTSSRQPAVAHDAIDVKEGDIYTYSVWIRRTTAGDGTVGMLLKFLNSSGENSNPIEGVTKDLKQNEWYRLIQTFIVPNGAVSVYGTPRITTSTQLKNFQIANAQLERGNKATDFTPSPDDIESKFSTITQTIDGVQTTVSNKADKSTVTQLAGVVDSKISTTDANNKFATQSQLTQTSNSLTSKISSVQTNLDNLEIGGRNLVKNSSFANGSSDWSAYTSSTTLNIIDEPNSPSGKTAYVKGIGGYWYPYGNLTVPLEKGKQYTVSLYAKGTGQVKFGWESKTTNTSTLSNEYKQYSYTFTWDGTNRNFIFYGNASTAEVYYHSIKIESGDKATGWTPAPEDMATSSQISQLSTAINLRVEKDKIVNQINVSTEGILISGSKIRITGDTTIDNAVIKNAMIADLSASKLTAGTINASTITVTNLNASNITTGTLNTDRIASNTIQTRHIATNAVTANEIATGTITASSGIIASIDAGKITTGTLSADRIGAYTITANKLTLSDFTNLCENPDFETDTVGSTPKGFNSSGVARVADISGFTNGNGSARALEIDARSTGNNDIYASNYIPVTPNQRFYVEFEGRYLNNAGTGVGRIGFRRYDAKRNALSSWDAVATATRGNNDQQFSRYSGTYNVPANCYFLQIWISFSNNGESTNKFYFDNIRVHRMSTAELIVDGAITTDKIASRAITADKIVTGTITAGSGIIANLAIGTAQIQDSAITNAKIANLSADKITSGYISASRIASNTITSNHINVTTLSAISANLGNVTAGNISGVNINIGNGAFTVNSSGSLVTNHGTFKGDMTLSGQFSLPYVNSNEGDIIESYNQGYGLKGDFKYTEHPNAFSARDIDGRVYVGNAFLSYISKVRVQQNGELYYGRTYYGATGVKMRAYKNSDNNSYDGSLSTLDNRADLTPDRFSMGQSGSNGTPNWVSKINIQSNGNANFSGSLTVGGNTTFNGNVILGTDSTLDAKNSDIVNVNKLTFNDPGANEGLEWIGGNGWKIFESNNSLNNGSGNLQFVTGSKRLLTIGTDGMIWSQATYDNTGGSSANVTISSGGYLARVSSSIRYKIYIKNVEDETENIANRILNLHPKSWFDRSSSERYADYLTRVHNGEQVDKEELDRISYIERNYGLIAEDLVEAGLGMYVNYSEPNKDGIRTVEGIEYDRLWTLLIPIVREQKDDVDNLKVEMKMLTERVSQLERENTILKQRLSSNGM